MRLFGTGSGTGSGSGSGTDICVIKVVTAIGTWVSQTQRIQSFAVFVLSGIEEAETERRIRALFKRKFGIVKTQHTPQHLKVDAVHAILILD